MSKARKTTLPWLTAGILLSLLIILLVLHGLTGQVYITDSEGIRESADTILNTIRTGDWQTLNSRIVGNPGIFPETGEDGSVENLIWKAYQNSLQWTFEDCYTVDGPYITQSLTVTCLDIPGIANAITGLPDTGSESQQEELLLNAAEQVLAAEPPLVTRQITLTFLREAGQWNLIPNRVLLMLLSGFTAH